MTSVLCVLSCLCVGRLLAGYPIVNDPLYNARAWGPHCGARGKGTEDMEKVHMCVCVCVCVCVCACVCVSTPTHPYKNTHIFPCFLFIHNMFVSMSVCDYACV